MKRSLYLFRSGELRRKDNSLCFVSEERTKHFPVENIEDIYLFGEVEVSKKLLEFVSQKGICLHYFNYYGYYVGTFYPREHLNAGYVLVRQAEHYLDPTKRMGLASAFVRGSIGQMSQVLRYYYNRAGHKETGDGTNADGETDLKRDNSTGGDKKAGRALLAATLAQLEQDAAAIDECTDIAELMAVEGHARERYYAAFDVILNNSDFLFEKRTKNPPLNRLNALISFGNSLCYTIVLSEIYKTYLDPRIGFLHTSNFRRFTLNLDIAEIFKPIMVDRLIFTLINKNMITKDDFDRRVGGVMLTETGRRTFVEELDKRMQTTVRHRHLGKSVSYRRLIRLELYKLQKHLLGEKEYKPYRSLW